jgi:hypothetical protein
MDKIKIEAITNPLTQEITDFVIIDRGNGEYTSMPKSTYDAMQAEQSTPMVADE